MKLKNIIYLHGYKGENSVKYQILKDYFGDEYNVIKFVQLPEPAKNIEKIENEVNSENSFIIGSSLGGFYGLLLSLRRNIPALLINPSFNPDMGQLKDEFPEKYLLQFAELKKEIRHLLESKDDFQIENFIAKDDELLNHTELINYFNIKNIPVHLFDDKGHGFKDFQYELAQVGTIIKEYE